jgi:hypothetical protein
MDSIAQPSEGYLLVPPVSTDSICDAMKTSFCDFDQDLFLNRLVDSGRMAEYAAAVYPTLVSSRIWPLDEEVLGYRRLILRLPEDDPSKGFVWLLDAARLRRDIADYAPTPDEVFRARHFVRNIGTRKMRWMSEGFVWRTSRPQRFDKASLRIYKVGDPHDSLAAYLYREAVEEDEDLWTPIGEGFRSFPVPAASITNDPPGKEASFVFPQAHSLTPGRYRIVVYRTGPPDDRSFYRIYLPR